MKIPAIPEYEIEESSSTTSVEDMKDEAPSGTTKDDISLKDDDKSEDKQPDQPKDDGKEFSIQPISTTLKKVIARGESESQSFSVASKPKADITKLDPLAWKSSPTKEIKLTTSFNLSKIDDESAQK